jgi:hypothetical protein
LLLERTATATVALSLQPDGVLGIDSRDGSEGPWQAHVTGQVRRCAPRTDRARLDLAAVLARCGTALDPQRLYDLAAGGGLQYGPAFRTVRELHFGADEALGTVELGADLDPAGYRLHPALLDGCFQSMLPLLLGDGTGPTFLPVGVRRMRLHASAGRTAHCHLRIARRGATSIELDMTITDGTGERIADLTGFRVRAVALGLDRRGRGTDDVIYEERPVPAARRGDGRVRDASHLPSPGALADPDELAGDFAGLRQELARSEHYRDVVPAMNRLTVDYLLAALERLGWAPTVGDWFTTDQLAAELDILDQHH